MDKMDMKDRLRRLDLDNTIDGLIERGVCPTWYAFEPRCSQDCGRWRGCASYHSGSICAPACCQVVQSYSILCGELWMEEISRAKEPRDG